MNNDEFTVSSKFVFDVAGTCDDPCSVPSTLSLVAINTVNGAKLIYKHSTSSTAGSVLFEGLNITSRGGCGEKLERCSILVFSESVEAITVVTLPLGEHFGIVTFNNESTSFTLREHHV